MADFYVKSGSSLERTNSAVVALGNKIVIARADVTANYLVVRKWVLECTTAGTTGAAVPAWPATVTQDTTTVTDGTAVFTFRKPGFSSGTTANWLFSGIFLDYVVSASAAGDTVYVSHLHTELISGSVTIACPGTNALPTRIICVNDAAAPPTAVATTGLVRNGPAATIFTINGAAYIYGLTLRCGEASGAQADLNIGADPGHMHLSNCVIDNASTNAGSEGRIAFPHRAGGTQDDFATICLENCSIKTAHVSTSLYMGGGKFEWRGGSFLAGSTPTFMWNRCSAGLTAVIDGVDLSALASTLNLGADNNQGAGYSITYRNCKLPASWAGSISVPDRPFTFTNLYNCDSADTNYRLHTSTYEGTVKSETTIVKTSGASDGTTALAWKMATTANAEYPSMLLTSPEIAYWNDTIAAAKTLTVEIVHDSLTNLKDDEVWLEVVYLGTAGFPLGSYIHDSKASVLATAADQTASAVAWTTTGLTNPNKQKLSVTVTPQEKGYYLARVKLAKASYTVYVDPLIVVT